MKPGRCLWLLPVLLVLAPAGAVIQRLYPLSELISGADIITLAKPEPAKSKARILTFTRTGALKGTPTWTKMAIQLHGGDNGAHIEVLRTRLKPGRTVLLFTKQKRFTLAYVEGTWFRLQPPADEKTSRWTFVHLEVYLRRTFKGTSAELQQVVADALSGKAAPPAPDPNVKPGYGS